MSEAPNPQHRSAEKTGMSATVMSATEIMIVFLILAVLAAIAWSSFSGARKAATHPQVKPTPTVAPSPVAAAHASSSSVPVAMILLIAGLITAAVVIGAVAWTATVMIRGRRRTAAAAEQARTQATEGRRRSWDAALARLTAVDNAYAKALLDPEYFLRFPLINDLTNPAIRAMEDAHETVLAYHTESYVDDAAWIATFSGAVDSFSAAWAAADGAARTEGLSPIPAEYRGNVDTAVKLMVHALDPAASEPERNRFRDKSLALLGNAITPRKQTLAAIAAQSPLALAAA